MQVQSTVRPIEDHDDRGIAHGLARAWKSVALKFKGLLGLIGNALVHDEGRPGSDHDLAWTSLSRVEHDTIPPSEVEKLSLSSIEHSRPVVPGGSPAGGP